MSLHNIGILTVCGLLLFSISSCRQEVDLAESYKIPPQPEISTGYSEKPGWATDEFAVATANPLATDAGYQIIQAGGSAADARSEERRVGKGGSMMVVGERCRI